MDRREEILYVLLNAESEDCRTRKQDMQFALTLNPDVDRIYNAMDENGKRMCLELLSFMADNDVECERLDDDNEGNEWRLFKYKGKRISAEELFENFL